MRLSGWTLTQSDQCPYKTRLGASLLIQWLKTCLPVQGKQI